MNAHLDRRSLRSILAWSFCLCIAAANAVDLTVPVAQGWNLLGNSTATEIDVAYALGDKTQVTTVWKWDSANAAWVFYSPAFATAADYPPTLRERATSYCPVLPPVRASG